MSQKYLIAAGGTGGHINPALAVAGYICSQEPDCEIRFVGTADHMEARLIPEAGYDFCTITISGIRRGRSPAALAHNAKLVLQLQQATQEAKRILREFRPDVVLGFGGYVSGPVLRAAARMKIPTAIHESNAFPGVANKALAKQVDAVMLTAADAEQYLKPKNPCVITGMPIRGELLEANPVVSRFELGFLEGRPLILSMGGSLGARPINEAVTEMIAAKYRARDCYFIHAAGSEEAKKTVCIDLQRQGIDLQTERHIDIRPYVDDMARCLSAADLVVCRAGASSINEFQALGKASILVPSPYLAENHQYYNALSLSERDAAVLMEEKDLNGESLTQAVDALLQDKGRLQQIGENAKAMAVTDANERIYRVVQGLIP